MGLECLPLLKRGMTGADFQSLGISDDMKERLNRLVIGVANIVADNFRKMTGQFYGRSSDNAYYRGPEWQEAWPQ